MKSSCKRFWITLSLLFLFCAVSLPANLPVQTLPSENTIDHTQPNPHILLGGIHIPDIEGKMLLVAIFILIVSTFISEDLTCIGAGILVANGNIPFFAAILGCYFGIVISDSLLFLAGRYIGQPLIKIRPFKWMIKQRDLDRSKQWFSNHGPIVILATRFIPGSRVPTYACAGIVDMHLRDFLLWFFIGASLWTPLLVYLSYQFGEKVIQGLTAYTENALWIALSIFALMLTLLHIVIPSFTWRGRRRLLSKWIRFTRFEFWPNYKFYPPVYAYMVLLGIKHKGITTLTAANPGIPDGGFIGESKSEILTNIKHPSVAAFICVDQDYAPRAEIFIADNNLSYPLVLKPDEGQRGEGVKIIYSKDELTLNCKDLKGYWIIQEYITGLEYGVFYYRYPGEQTGAIFSITDKRFTSVTGDGVSTLEKLILQDARAVCQADIHLDANRKDLFTIPPENKEIKLVELGTHCRGSLFKNGNHLHTAKLEQVIDDIAQSFEGFYIGRFDIRCPSIESLREGEGIRVLELNGVTSESTDIYDPENTLFSAYKTVFRQLRITYAIGAINKKAGHKATPFWEIIKNGLEFEAKD